MNLEITSAIFGLVLLCLYFVYFLKYREYMLGKQQKDAQAQKDTAVQKTLDKFFVGKKKEETMQKFSEMESIKSQIEASISATVAKREAKAKKQLKEFSNESEVIEEGGMKYFSFFDGMKSAIPETEEERTEDMSNLMDAVKQLEMMDADNYGMDDQEITASSSGGLGGMDMGKAMFYDNLSQKLKRVIKEQNFAEKEMIQAEILENIAMDKVRTLSHKDFIETLKLMKNYGYIKDVIEINPEISFVTFKKINIKFSTAEKVVISFAFEEKILTMDRLKEHTLWKPSYLNRILKGLQNKNLLEIVDENLVIKGIMDLEEKEEYLRKKNEIKENELEKKKKLEELEKQRRDMLLSKKRAEQKKQDELMKEQQEQLLEEAREKVAKDRKKIREEVDKLTEQEEQVRLEKIKSMPKPSIKSLPSAGGPKSGVSLPKPVLPKFSQSKPISPIPNKQENVSKDALNLARAAEDFEATSKMKKDITSFDEKALKTKQDEITAKTQKGKSPTIIEEGEEIDLDAFESLLEEVPDDDGFGELNGTDMSQFESMLEGAPNDDGFGDDDGLSDLKNLVNLMETKSKQLDAQKGIKKEMNNLENFFSDVDKEQAVSDELSENQETIDIIINVANDLADKTGGLLTLNFILKVLNESDHPDLKRLELMEILEEMKEQHIIFDEINVAGETIYLFDDLVFDDEMLGVLKQFVLEGKMDGDSLLEAMGWDVEHLGRVLKRFLSQNILQATEDREYFIPGLFNLDKK